MTMATGETRSLLMTGSSPNSPITYHTFRADISVRLLSKVKIKYETQTKITTKIKMLYLIYYAPYCNVSALIRYFYKNVDDHMLGKPKCQIVFFIIISFYTISFVSIVRTFKWLYS